MPSATAITTKTWIITEEELCACRPVSSCWLSFIQLSAVRPVSAASSCAMASAAKTSSTLTSMVVMPPARSSRVWAWRSETSTQRWFTSLLPTSKMPLTVKTSPRPCGVVMPELVAHLDARGRGPAPSPMTASVPSTRKRPGRDARDDA